MLLGIYTPTLFLKLETINRIVLMTEQWCEKNIGRNHKKKFITLYVRNQKFGELPCYGQYDCENSAIHVYTNRCENIKEIIRCVLHEYTHHLQPIETRYEKLLKKYGYDNHPMEIEAEKNEEYYLNVWDYIKSN
jgi:hypothetical protein